MHAIVHAGNLQYAPCRFLCRRMHPHLSTMTAAIWSSEDAGSHTWRREAAFAMVQLASEGWQRVTDAMLEALAQLPSVAWIDAQPWPRQIAPRLITAMRNTCRCTDDRQELAAAACPVLVPVLTIHSQGVANDDLQSLFVYSGNQMLSVLADVFRNLTSKHCQHLIQWDPFVASFTSNWVALHHVRSPLMSACKELT